MSFPPLHVITDDAVVSDPAFAGRARAVLEAGGPRLALHLRAPRGAGRMLYEVASGLLDDARRSGALLVVNDRVDVALAAGADGVQLGGRSLPVADVRTLWPDAWIGASVHAVDEAIRAAETGTDFVILGTIYPTPSHPDRPGAGRGRIAATAAAVRVPVVAIGGIDVSRVAEVRASGAGGLAVLGAVWRAEDAARAAATLLDAWDVEGQREIRR